MREYDVGGYQRAFNVGYCLGKLLSENCIGHSVQPSQMCIVHGEFQIF